MTIKILGIAVSLCLILITVYAYGVGRPLELRRDTSLSFAMSEDFKDLLSYAAMAPSGHNTQPWKVQYRAKSNKFTLVFDSSRSLPQVDPCNREALLSLGAFLENWRQAAEAYGYEASITIAPDLAATMEIAEVTFTAAGKIPADAEQRLDRLRTRHSDKRPYEASPIPVSAISEIEGKHQPHLHFYPKGTPEYAWLSTAAVKAMRAQAQHKGKRIELANWIRFSNSEARQMKDGLPAEQLNLRWLMKALFYTFYSREDAAKESFALEAVTQTEQHVNNAAGFFVVTGASNFMGTVQAGMHFEKFWLDAVALGISIHPMSQILEEEPFSDTVMKTLGLDTPVQMIVRAGMNREYGRNNGIRRDISGFTSQKE